ncbi:MAG TPA: thiamine pyrophosphate-dependent enzyme, partial [Candidatus Dormibacteraeota bacterium]|nr:thiamine pyrophosphate-dependent enzyme [Candidatus Dormibacteraeota bacterium]
GDAHCGYDPNAARIAPQCTPLSTQTLHATGLAMAARLRGDPVVALTFFGEGSSSEGDAHEAMNIAGVHQAPVIFLLQNNQYAISVPVRLQTRAASFAQRAAGYGIHGVRVDGNDVLSVYGAVRTAVERARAGGGPTLVEAVTFRMEAHTTADDMTRYRTTDETAIWEARDPLPRYLTRLRDAAVVDDAFVSEVDAEGEQIAQRMRDSLFGAPGGDPREMFDHVYASLPAHLQAQRQQLQNELSAAEGS